MTGDTGTKATHARLRLAWSSELDQARRARSSGDASGEWAHLERSHILSQPMAGPHARTHFAMLGAAIRRRDAREVLGQLFRFVVAAPGSLTGKYPVGNTGGADVSAFAPMPIPEDLQDILASGSAVPPNAPQPDDEEATFSTDPTGLDEATPTEVVELRDGDTYELRIAPVAKTVGRDRLRMLSYNGAIPGPVLHVEQGSEVTFTVVNDGDLEATVHWHGLRLQNRYDGVPFETQEPIPVGGSYVQKVTFPDPGMYWYHPHIREDYGLELGLYGTVVVEPDDPSYWPPADRFLSITLDDLLLEDGKIAPFLRAGPNYTAMGRFGNVMLTNGETDFTDAAAVGEVVRLYVVNCANTRIFKFALDGARMKLVGGDSGRCEAESFVESVLLAPSERAVLDVRFDAEGDVSLEHRTPERIYRLGTISVAGAAAGDAAGAFDELRTDEALRAIRGQLAHHLERPPDKTLAFWSEMPLLYGDDGTKTTTDTAYHECPMHSDVAASFAATCPKCGMKLVPTESPTPTSTPYACPMHEEIVASWAATCPRCGMTLVVSNDATASDVDESEPHIHDHGDTIEWEDDMVAINRETNTENMIWQLIDRDTGAKNAEIQWRFTVGDQVKIRLVNEMGSDHPMPHPFHVHGAGRFLVLAKDGVVEENLVWKDTVLLLAGQTVDILLDVTNPGLWMAHCHIAEHNQSGMMFSFEVAPNPAVAGTS